MNSTLIVFTQGPLAGQTLLEALSATLVMATFGIPVKLCFQGDALTLLKAPSSALNSSTQAFKSAYAIIESFEFYDVLPVWVSPDSTILEQQINGIDIEHEVCPLDATILATFDQVIYW